MNLFQKGRPNIFQLFQENFFWYMPRATKKIKNKFVGFIVSPTVFNFQLNHFQIRLIVRARTRSVCEDKCIEEREIFF